jgi:hypothetical protein
MLHQDAQIYSTGPLLFRLTPKEVDEMLQKLPKLNKNSEYFFRNLGNNGLISFRYRSG